MKRRSIVAANWKMNGNSMLINDMIKGLSNLQLANNSSVVVCPSFPYLAEFSTIATTEQLQENVHLGCQNVSEHNHGAYTGEVSTDMLKECSVDFVIVGHSERRNLFKESSSIVAQKVAKVLDAGLTPILCIGESEDDRENNRTNVVLSAQLQSVVDIIGIEKFVDVVIAYEPIWAIGTGKTASPEMAQETHQFIRKFIAKMDEDISTVVPLLYGGSVNSANSATLFAQPDIDGGLIGGASLKVDEFTLICSAMKG